MKNQKVSFLNILFLFFLFLNLAIASDQKITIVAGGGCGDGGSALDASIGKPNSLKFDESGNLYFADTLRGSIREIDSKTNVVTTVLPTINNSEIQENISDYHFDSEGNIYFPLSNQRQGIGEVVKGTGEIKTVIDKVQVSGLEADSDGNLYYSMDYKNIVCRYNKSTGVTEVIAGKEVADSDIGRVSSSSSEFNRPTFLLLDKSKNLYVFDAGNHCIKKINLSTGAIQNVPDSTTTYPSEVDKPGGPSFVNELSMALDKDDNLYFCDIDGKSVKKYNSQNNQTENLFDLDLINLPPSKFGPKKQIKHCTGISVDKLGNLYLAFALDGFIVRSSPDGKENNVFAGNPNFTGDGLLATQASCGGSSIAFDSNKNMYLAEVWKIRRVDAKTGIISTIAQKTGYGVPKEGVIETTNQIFYPTSLCFETNGNLIFLSNGIQEIDMNAKTIKTILNFDQLCDPREPFKNIARAGMTIDGENNIYFTYGGYVRELVRKTGKVITLIGGPGLTYREGGTISENKMGNALDVALDNDGNLYVADEDGRVCKVDVKTKIITTIAGTGGNGYYGNYSGDDQPATLSGLQWPQGLAIDNNGNVYISDGGNHKIRMVEKATGKIRLIADGNAGKITLGPDGCLYFAAGGPVKRIETNYSQGPAKCDHTQFSEEDIQKSEKDYLLKPKEKIIGEDWQLVANRTAFEGNNFSCGVVYDGKMWLIGGNDRSVWVSDNGIDWKQISQNAPFEARDRFTAVVFQNKIWVLGRQGIFCTSNGSDWETINNNPEFIPYSGYGVVVYDEKIWLMGGAFGPPIGDIWCTGDGKKWSLVTKEPKFKALNGLSAVVFDGKIWLLGASNVGLSTNETWCSTDGENWNEVNDSVFSGSIGGNAIAANNAIVLIGDNNVGIHVRYSSIRYSTDGFRWTLINDENGKIYGKDNMTIFTPRKNSIFLFFKEKIWAIGGLDKDDQPVSDVWSSE